ncbi:MAG: hypothetical protein GY788_11825, partial [bacterium]|nr:hypothetical protein [bacterium]
MVRAGMADRFEVGHGVVDYGMYVDGAWHYADRASRIEVENPANEDIVATIPEGTPDDAIA